MAKTRKPNTVKNTIAVLCAVVIYTVMIIVLRNYLGNSSGVVVSDDVTGELAIDAGLIVNDYSVPLWYSTGISSSQEGAYDTVVSQYAIMINASTQKIIYNKNANAQAPIASLTKIMTALVAIEQLDSLDEEYMFTADVIRQMNEAHASVAGFAVGEHVSARDLLYAVMLPSGGDSAVGIACLVAGSEENFVVQMNDMADKLGMKNTRFYNSTGLDEEGKNNYSTAADIAMLLDAALHSKAFYRIITTTEYLTQATEQHPDGILLRSTLCDLLAEYNLEDTVTGGKTGFTEFAGLCLASFCDRGNERYIAVTLGAGDGTKTPEYNFEDAAALYALCE